jgi:hypothetical protein
MPITLRSPLGLGSAVYPDPVRALERRQAGFERSGQWEVATAQGLAGED